MPTISLRPAEPERDFKQLALWFSLLEDDPSTEASLKEYYAKEIARITQRVAENEQGELLGFYWAIRERQEPSQVIIFLYVKPEQRGQGIGRRLYTDLERVTVETGAKQLRVGIGDNQPEGRRFAERCGFTERLSQIAMALNLTAFDDRPYDALLAKLKGEGFQFTSLEALGNTEDAQRKLYRLNNMTGSESPGSDGEPAWTSFEDYQQRVCQAAWYKPGGELVVIESATGEWVAMSAITRMAGNDYAYNLHTGVDKRYRGRKLAQAVKVLALRYAREVLQATEVRSHHNIQNLAMIAINHKFGYRQISGSFLMEKVCS